MFLFYMYQVHILPLILYKDRRLRGSRYIESLYIMSKLPHYATIQF